ncbi:TolC family protein [Caminibacter mediatlanticus]|uniref:Uncharacterized protein n=1 Tax=Caminibacter mediatlanticus TB-2 TaxID=391592 RepID=A0AAI9AG30_9BACT|nr:TolC family protein [Caminibacter mediatlanticus]EDM23516.1 hypothetical protein CMTB2_08272 [Caminibacter mediatlanticus TB-2]
MKFLIICIAIFLNAYTINELLNKVKTIEDTKLDEIFVKNIKENKKEINSALYPKINIFTSYEHFTIPTSIIPLPPTEVNPKEALPFSQNVLKLGFNISFPIFVKEVYENKKKMDYLIKSAKITSKINLLKREVLLINLISKLNYQYRLKSALLKKQDSIKKTIKSIEVGVKNGVIAEFKLIRLKDSLNSLDIEIENLLINIDNTKSEIYKLTKVYLNKEIEINSFLPKKRDFFASKSPKREYFSIKTRHKSKKIKTLSNYKFECKRI